MHTSDVKIFQHGRETVSKKRLHSTTTQPMTMQIQGVVSWVWVTPNGSGLDGGLQMDFISTTQQYTKQSCCPCRRTSLQCHQTLLAVLACVEWWRATAAKTSVHRQYTQHAHTSTCYINFVPHIYFTHKVTDPVQHLCSKRLHRRTCSVR